MSQWTARIENHKLYKTLEALDSAIEGASDPKDEFNIVDARSRAQAVLTFLRHSLNQADPLLVSPILLNTIDDALQQVLHHITSYIDNGNLSHWEHAQNALDSCCVLSTSIPHQTPIGLNDMSKSSFNFHNSVSHLLSTIKADGDGLSKMQFDLQQKIIEATTEVSNQKQRLDTAIATFQQQFSDSQQIRQTEFSTAEQARLATAQTSEEARQNSYESAKQQRTEDFEQITSSAKKAHADLVDELKVTAKATIELITTQKEHAQKLVGIITNTGMAYGFQKNANDERKSALIWSIIAVIAMSTWIIIGCVFFSFTYDKELTLPSVVRQFLISTPFVLLSGFAAIRVAQHQKNERSMRKSELEIASIDPFLATLSDVDRNEVKREFATRYFGQKDIQEKQEPTPSNLVDLAGALVKVVQDLTKK